MSVQTILVLGLQVSIFLTVLSLGMRASFSDIGHLFGRPGQLIKSLLSMFLIMPVFAFANAGLPLGGLSLASLTAPLPLGIMAGLFIGKQIGIVLGAGLLIVLGIAALPQGATWRGLYGVAILGGIGFTMSLFIGTLAFPDDATREAEVRLGVLAGSILSAVAGWLVLRSQRKFA